MTSKLYIGDCLDVLNTLDENSIDTCITDPPYGLGFMGKKWDSSGIAFQPETWQAVYRVLKPGALLLAFGGTRTYHRMVCAIEDAGFEIRDTIGWVYGSGFPKSLDISKAIDKKPKADRVTEFKNWLATQIEQCPKSKAEIDKECGFTACSYAKTDGKDYWSTNLPKNGKWEIMKKVIGITSNDYDWVAEDNVDERGYISPTGGLAGGSGNTVGKFTGKQLSENAISPEAQLWNGWGTALKPAMELIVVAMKPLDGTYAENALKWGMAGYWIDGGRIESGDENIIINTWDDGSKPFGGGAGHSYTGRISSGRYPSNLIHDGSDEVLELFPQTGKSTCGRIGNKGSALNMMGTNYEAGDPGYGDSGSAARFFYCAKASRAERNAGLEDSEPKWIDETRKPNSIGGNNPRNRGARADMNFHPTVKPLKLMQYLVRLTKTPYGGIVLDPFMGSGTTGIACALEGRDFIGIEKESEYYEIAEKRINYALMQQRLL